MAFATNILSPIPALRSFGIFMAVCPQNILMIDVESKDVLKTYPYENVMNYGSGSNRLVLKVGNIVVQRTLKFHTEVGEAQQIVQLIKLYMNEIARQIAVMEAFTRIRNET